MTLREGLSSARMHVALARGYAIYRQRTQNPCPGCGHSHWLVGRIMAECAFCETALPLEHSFRFTGLSQTA